ncbi:MAG: hypothetical protein PHE83_16740 [Opitutaceae bacterium]|nr:hypothetical protein [Opitutaceae bacterium]
MKITLTKISYSAALSDETNAFSATVCIDGVPSLTVYNRGTGGGHDYGPFVPRRGPRLDTPEGRKLAAYRAMKRLEEYAASLPPRALPGPEAYTLQPDADMLVDDAFEEWLREGDVKRNLRKLKTHVLMVKDDKLYSIKPHTPLPVSIEMVKRKYPGAIIVNCLDAAAAEELIRQTLTQLIHDATNERHLRGTMAASYGPQRLKVVERILAPEPAREIRPDID